VTLALDTSVVIRLLTGTPPAQAERARAVIGEATTPIAVSDLVIAEAYFALRHHYGAGHRETIQALTAMIRDPRLVGSSVAPEVLAALHAGDGTRPPRPGLMDQLIHADYARSALELVTFDRDLARLTGTRLLADDGTSAG
jgi:predicted nucleic acid-binding protein